MGHAVKWSRPNPYCGFKDDRERRTALISRDVRLVLIVGISAVAGAATHWMEVLTWLKTLFL